MPLIALKCPQCGADLKMDDSREFMFCEFCGAKVIKEQINNITIANGVALHDADWYYNSITELIKKRDISLAKNLTETFKHEHPLDDRWREIEDFLSADAKFHNLADNYNPYPYTIGGCEVLEEYKQQSLKLAEEVTAAREKLNEYSRYVPDMTIYDDLYNDFMTKNRAYVEQIEKRKRDILSDIESTQKRRALEQQKKHEKELREKRAEKIKKIIIWSIIGFIAFGILCMCAGW